MRPARWSLLLLLAPVACGDLILPASDVGDDGGATADDTTNGDDGDAASDAADAHAGDVGVMRRADSSTLDLVSFTASAASIGPGQTITFAAIVSDSLGESNIISARLLDDSGATYATFQGSGSFTQQVTLSWNQIESTRAVGSPPASRTFSAVFADRLGYVASASVVVGLGAVPPPSVDAGAPDVLADAPVDSPPPG